MNYREAEQHKKNGWNLYHSGTSVSERARGLHMVIEAHFSRNPEAPNFETYAAHWLWALQGRCDPEVLALLIDRYPLPTSPRIQREYSDWDSYGKPGYRPM